MLSSEESISFKAYILSLQTGPSDSSYLKAKDTEIDFVGLRGLFKWFCRTSRYTMIPTQWLTVHSGYCTQWLYPMTVRSDCTQFLIWVVVVKLYWKENMNACTPCLLNTLGLSSKLAVCYKQNNYEAICFWSLTSMFMLYWSVISIMYSWVITD